MPKIKGSLTCGIDCTLKDKCKHKEMAMEGNPNIATIAFVGEAPGADEDRIGLPFMGQAGKLLRETIARHQIGNFCITNAVRCRPPGNRTPTAIEIATCNARLLADLASIKHLKLIVPLGAVAITALLGGKYKSISKFSGKLIQVGNMNYLPVFHPAYILRNRGELKTFEEHLGRIPQALLGSLTSAADFGSYGVISTIDEWTDIVNGIIKTGYFTYDLETTGLSPFLGGNVRCIGLSFKDREAWALQWEDCTFRNKELFQIKDDLRVLFTSNKIGKVGHNVKFDNLWVEVALGFKVNNTIWDTKYSQFLLNENESNDLKDMAWKYSQMGGYEKLLEAEPQVAQMDKLLTYCATDCDLTHRIYLLHKQQLPKELHYLMTNLMIPATNALVEAEVKGIKVDPSRIEECEDAVDFKIKDLLAKVSSQKSVRDFETEHGEFNLNSPQQKATILFKYEGLTPEVFTKTKKPSTSRAVLEALAHESPLCALLAEYSLYQSLKSKTIAEMKKYSVNDRIHTFYSLTRTVTGRTASRNPNMQNAPKGSKDAVGVRQCFVADKGFLLAEFDLNQHELRCMAEIAGDDVLAKAILSSDVHRSTAGSILGKLPSQVTDEERRNIGKTFNFGLIYGLTEHGVMKRLKCSELVAKMYIQKFFDTYNKTKQWMDITSQYARTNGHVTSLTGRIRHFSIWDELDDKSVREAINMPIQSLASDILLYGLIGVSRLLRDYRSYVCLEVHDSIVCNIHKEELHLIPEIQKVMTESFKKHMRFVLPLKVDVKIGPSWGEMRDYETGAEPDDEAYEVPGMQDDLSDQED